jgi:TolB-like protein
MPFVNESGDPEMEYLSDGMTETLLNSLSQLPNLSVKARSSVFRYKGKDTDVKTIGRELDAQALLNGRVVQRGQHLVVYLELVDAQTGNRIWGEQYDRIQADLISLQTELAHDVSQKLRTKLSGADEQILAKTYTNDTEAYQLYLRGRYHANKFTVDDWQKAVDYYKQSIDRDPAFPLPYVGLAEYYQMNSNGTLAPIVAQPNAEAYALKALAIDDQLAEAHSALGAVRFYRDWDWPAAEKEFIRAVELSPNSAGVHYWYSYPATASGHYDIGISEMQRALELDPLNETINADLGWAYYCAGKTDEALASYKRALELQPDFPMVWGYLGLAYERQGKYAEAIAELQRARERENVPTTLGYLGYVLARSGNSAGARQVIEELKAQSTQKFVSPYFIAMIYAALGEKDQAFAYLEKAYEVRADSMAELRHDPLLGSLRPDPRFSELLAKVETSN